VKSRRLASLALVAAVLVGTSGCALISPQATLIPYAPADGVSAHTGDVAVRNALIVSELRDPAGRDYVMVVNNSPFESDQAELVLTGRRPEVYRVDWMAKEEHLTKGDRFSGIPRYGEDFAVLRPNLCPGQMELYRVEAGG